MKIAQLIAVVLLPLAVACGGSSSTKTGATCAQTQSCIQACTSANSDTCVPACIAQLSTAAKSYFDSLQDCSEPACATVSDGGATPPCASPGASACTTCVATNCGAEESACLSN